MVGTSFPASCFPGWLAAYWQCNSQRPVLNQINQICTHAQFQTQICRYAGQVGAPSCVVQLSFSLSVRACVIH
ncbi:hypothetical protein BJX76DRAFT_326552 [Aspergillus varians]